jgi:prepilin signal peptidase PulO-like enzyme (type II secretory pathway)
VEFITGFLFALVPFVPPSDIVFYLVFICLAIPISVVDFETMLIPEKFLIPLILMLALGRLYNWQWYILGGGLVLFLVHGLIHLIAPDAFGFGDVLFAAAVGLMFHPALDGIWFVITYALGTAFGLMLIAIKKTGRKTPIPFAPVMFVGALITIFFGWPILQWYESLFF